jgi:hypothetical protein
LPPPPPPYPHTRGHLGILARGFSLAAQFRRALEYLRDTQYSMSASARAHSRLAHAAYRFLIGGTGRRGVVAPHLVAAIMLGDQPARAGLVRHRKVPAAATPRPAYGATPGAQGRSRQPPTTLSACGGWPAGILGQPLRPKAAMAAQRGVSWLVFIANSMVCQCGNKLAPRHQNVGYTLMRRSDMARSES